MHLCLTLTYILIQKKNSNIHCVQWEIIVQVPNILLSIKNNIDNSDRSAQTNEVNSL